MKDKTCPKKTKPVFPVELKPSQFLGDWGIRMTIGNQSFEVGHVCECKRDVKIHQKMLKIALENAGCKVVLK